MGRDAYLDYMRQRLRDLGIQIGSVHSRLADSPDNRMKVDLVGQIALLEHRRDAMREKLEALKEQSEGVWPEGVWDELLLEIEDEWDTLVQDFEERVAGLA